MTMDFLEGKNVLVTGGTGSLGKTLVKKLLATEGTGKIIIFSRDELKQYHMVHELGDDPRLRFFLGDVRDFERLKLAFHGVDIVIHTAALKQVPMLEYNPFEAIKTNVIGTENVIHAAMERGVEKVLVISSDKACNPVNLYGATKLCAEKLAVSANAYTVGRPIVAAMRYGNVFGSRGSLVTLIEQAKETTNKMKLTHEEMTRFWLTLDQCAEHIFYFLSIMQGGEIYVPKLPSMKVKDFILSLAPDIELEVIGIRPGEKVHERLLTDEEVRHTLEFEDYYIVEPQQEWWSRRNHKDGKPIVRALVYASDVNEWQLTGEELKEMLGRDA